MFQPQVEEFMYLGVLFTSEGSMEHEIDCSGSSNVVYVPVCCVEEGADPKGEALDLLVNLHFYTHLWS